MNVEISVKDHRQVNEDFDKIVKFLRGYNYAR